MARSPFLKFVDSMYLLTCVLEVFCIMLHIKHFGASVV